MLSCYGSYVEIWAKPWGGFRPETKPLGRLSCEGGMGAEQVSGSRTLVGERNASSGRKGGREQKVMGRAHARA